MHAFGESGATFTTLSLQSNEALKRQYTFPVYPRNYHAVLDLPCMTCGFHFFSVQREVIICVLKYMGIFDNDFLITDFTASLEIEGFSVLL